MGFKHGKPLRSFWIHAEQAAGEMFRCLCNAVVVGQNGSETFTEVG